MNVKNSLPGALLSATLFSIGSVFVFGDTVTLSPVADTSLHEINPANNMGGHNHIAAGTTGKGTRSRGLIQFDLENKIPPNATITSAKLTLKVTLTPPGGRNSTFGLHRVLKPWGEGDKTGNLGAPAGADEATWNARLAPGTTWGSPGGATGTDYTAAASATVAVAGPGSYVFSSTPELLNDVKAWLANPDSNFGWMLLSQSESVPQTARRFGALEDAANAPPLVIEFSAAPQATAPAITAQPQSQTVLAGAAVTFSITASGTAPLSYQWKFNGADIPGATGSNFVLNNAQPANAGNYTVVVSNSAGSAASSPASLTINQPPPPSLSVSDVAVIEGNSSTINAVFSVSLSAPSGQQVTVSFATSDGTATAASDYVSQSGTLSFVPGVTNMSISVTVRGDSLNETDETFFVSLSNPINSAIVKGQGQGTIRNDDFPLSITTQPQSQTITLGSTATFTTTAVGSGTLRYQWKFNGVDIPGASNSTFVLSNVQPSNAGSYTVVVSNPAGSVTSDTAVLTVNTAPEKQPRIDRVERAANGVNVVFTVEPTYEIALEFADSLPATAWLTLTNVAAKASAVVVNFPEPTGPNAQRFYRLKVTGRIR